MYPNNDRLVNYQKYKYKIRFDSKKYVTVLLHHRQELDHHLGRGSDEDLALSASFSIAHALQSVIENTDAHHRFLLRKRGNKK